MLKTRRVRGRTELIRVDMYAEASPKSDARVRMSREKIIYSCRVDRKRTEVCVGGVVGIYQRVSGCEAAHRRTS